MGCIFEYLKYVVIGFLIYKIVQIIRNIVYPYFFAIPHNLQVLAGSRWALVTGSTDGIGKAYAFELAKKGFNLILVSLTQSKLDLVSQEINEKYDKIEIITIQFDFSNANVSDYETKIFEKIKHIEIGILVNNVGLSTEYPERLHQIKGGLKRIVDITIINTVPTTLLSAFVLEQMSKRRSGVIVNISSAASCFPIFYWNVYSATKKYVCWLSEILRKEYESNNIIIQTVSPMMVATKMSKIRKDSFFIPNPTSFAAEAVRSIGHINETAGCASHQIQFEIIKLLPNFIFDKISKSESIKLNLAALRKLNKEAVTKQE